MSILCGNCGHTFDEGTDVLVSPVEASNILGTNRVPSQQQSDLIRATVTDILPQLAHVDEELARIQAILDRLTVKRKRLRDYWLAHKRQLSPILRFPPEIMGEIFLYSLPENWKMDTALKAPRKPHDRAVVIPGQVCKFWRQVSLTTPKMWSKISVSMYSPRAINFDVLDTWLQRSSQAPLSIHLVGFCSKTKRVLAKLSRHIHRWSDIDCEGVSGKLLDAIWEYMDRMSLARTLYLQASSDTMFVPSSTNRNMALPNLRKLRLQGLDPLAPTIGAIPWSQLTEVEVMGCHCGHYLEYLRTATNLHSLTMRYRCHDPLPSTIPLHLHLQILDVQVYSGSSDLSINGRLLDLLTLPGLKVFKGLFPNWPKTEFLSLLSRSGCALEALTMSCYMVPIDVHDIVECLRHVPSISELNFGFRSIENGGEAIFNHLAVDRTLVPGLERIGVHFVDALQLSAAVPIIVSMATSRENATGVRAEGCCIKSLILFFSLHDLQGSRRNQSRIAVEALMRSKPSGLDIRLEHDGQKISLC